MWNLFRKPAPVDPEVFKPPLSPPTVNVTVRIERSDFLAAMLAAACADASDSKEKFLQLYKRATSYLEGLE